MEYEEFEKALDDVSISEGIRPEELRRFYERVEGERLDSKDIKIMRLALTQGSVWGHRRGFMEGRVDASMAPRYVSP